jgi:hypothetical protein
MCRRSPSTASALSSPAHTSLWLIIRRRGHALRVHLRASQRSVHLLPASVLLPLIVCPRVPPHVVRACALPLHVVHRRRTSLSWARLLFEGACCCCFCSTSIARQCVPSSSASACAHPATADRPPPTGAPPLLTIHHSCARYRAMRPCSPTGALL